MRPTIEIYWIIMDLQTQLDGKSDIGHTHDNSTLLSLAWAKLTGVPSTFAPSAHVHTLDDVAGLVSALAGKLNTSDFPVQLSLNVTNLSTLLAIPSVVTAVPGQTITKQADGSIAWTALPTAGSPDGANDPRPARYGEGLLAARPSALGTILGHFYRTTDESPSTLYRCNGTGWDAIASVSASTTNVVATSVMDNSIRQDALDDELYKVVSYADTMASLLLNSYTL